MSEAALREGRALSLRAPAMAAALSGGAEAVLVLRFGGGDRRPLFALVAAGSGACAVAHLAVPAQESSEGLVRMFRAFQASDPGWRRVRSFLVDPRLCGRLEPALSEAFPGTEVLPSALHPLLQLRRGVRLSPLRPAAQRLLLSALSAAACAPRPENLRALRAVLAAFLPPPRSPPESLLEPRLWNWGPLRSPSWGQRRRLLQGLERLALSLGRAFRQGPSLDSRVAALAQTYELLCRDPPRPPPAPSLPPPSPPPAAPEEFPAQEEAVRGFQRALRELCAEPGVLLCQGELWALQHSQRLVGLEEDAVQVQILEEERAVTPTGWDSCSCPFARDFQLPCRHLLAVLNTRGKEVDPGRIPARWRRGRGVSQAVFSDEDVLLEVLSGSRDGTLDKRLAVSLLTEQIGLLLSGCSRDEFSRRCCTLRELADSWIGPYLQVKL